MGSAVSGPLSDAFIKPGQSPLFDSPSNYGLDFEDVTFQTEDGVSLSGWLIKGPTDKIIIQSHFGVQCNRAGWEVKGKGMGKMWDRDINFLKFAKHLSEQGYSMLTYDLRGHGQSQLSEKCPWVSWGPEEAKDVVAAVKFVEGRPDYKNASIGLLSICMGSNAMFFAFGNHGLADKENVKAVVSVQPSSWNVFTGTQGIPGFLLRSVEAKNLERTGMDYTKIDYTPFIKAVKCPTLMIQNANDPATDHDYVQRCFDLLEVQQKEYHKPELTKSRFAGYAYLTEQPEVLSNWFNQHMK